MAQYPAVVPTDLADLVVQGMPMQNLVDIVGELVAVMVTLGTNPHGSSGTVANRFAAQDTPSATQVIDAAADIIVPNARTVVISNTTGGSITLTSTPTIADGVNGQRLTILNVGTQGVELKHGVSFNLRLTGSVDHQIGHGILLVFSTAAGDWMEIS